MIPAPEVYATVLTLEQPLLFVGTPDGEVAMAQIPGGAKTIIKLAHKNGWATHATYARGPWLHASGDRITGIVDHVRVTMLRGQDFISASWRDLKFETATYMPRSGPSAIIDSRAMKELLKA